MIKVGESDLENNSQIYKENWNRMQTIWEHNNKAHLL